MHILVMHIIAVSHDCIIAIYVRIAELQQSNLEREPRDVRDASRAIYGLFSVAPPRANRN